MWGPTVIGFSRTTVSNGGISLLSDYAGRLLFHPGFLERSAFDLGPNVELITASMLVASAYLSRRQSWLLTLAVLAATDLILGNSLIFIFTWSGFLLPALLLPRLMHKRSALALRATGLGLASNLFFYIWTNFGFGFWTPGTCTRITWPD